MNPLEMYWDKNNVTYHYTCYHRFFSVSFSTKVTLNLFFNFNYVGGDKKLYNTSWTLADTIQ